MKPKTTLELLADAEAIYTAVSKAKLAASDRISRVSGYEFSKAYQETESTNAKNHYRDFRSSAIIQLSKIKDRIAETAAAEEPSLQASAVDANFLAILQMPGLTARDFTCLARTYANNYTKCRMLEGAAKANCYILKTRNSAEDVTEAATSYIERLTKLLQNDNPRLDAPLLDLNDIMIADSGKNARKLLEPLSPDEIQCYASTEAEITADITKEMQKDIKESADAFTEGFTGRKEKPLDYADYPALAAASDRLDEVNLPSKKTRILDGLVSALDAKRLKSSEPLTAQELKAASDKTLGYNEPLAAELREFADLFLPDEGMRFVAAPGMELTEVTPSYNEPFRWEALKREANALQTKEAEINARNIAMNTASTNAQARQARREADEANRYKSIETVRRDGNANGNLHAD